MELGEIIPYGSVFIDSSATDIAEATRRCFIKYSDEDRRTAIREITETFTNDSNLNYVLPCYSVRTGFDLFLDTINFPPESELIMSAVNIPDMVRIARFHKLKIIPVDIDLDTVAVDVKDLEYAMSDRTVAILVAHIYGKWMDVSALVNLAKRRGIYFLEDCAESFCGFKQLGNPQSDICFFSFGTIKTCTSFGGAVLKIKDRSVYDRMSSNYSTYPLQTPRDYGYKLQKCLAVYHMLNVPCLMKKSMEVTRVLSVDHQKFAVQMMRGFSPLDIRKNIRKRPCTAMLNTMATRFKAFDEVQHEKNQEKAAYVMQRLPPEMNVVGSQAPNKHRWLFPVLTENPNFVVTMLKHLGVDAYVGSTQLDIVQPEEDDQIPNVAVDEEMMENVFQQSMENSHFPHRSKHLIDHVIYLPVHKRVPYTELDKICFALHVVAAKQKLMSIPSTSGESRAKL